MMDHEEVKHVIEEIDSRELDDQVSHETLNYVFQSILKTSSSTTLFPLMVIAVMWTEIDHGILIVWGLLVLTNIVIRYGVAVSYLRRDVPVTEIHQWGRRYTLTALFSAVIWSSTVFLFYVEDSVPHQVFLFSLVMGLGISTVMAGAYWLPVFYLGGIPVMGTMIVRLALEGTVPYIALAVLLLLYLFLSRRLAKGMHKALRSERHLRHESAALAKALQIKTEETQQATQAKSVFLAAASHDLRQPLHTLALFIDVLKESKSEAERAKLFPRIELSLEALRKLFDALLDVSRLDAKTVNPELSHFDLAELLKSLAEEFKPDATEKGLKLRVDAWSSIVKSDRLLLERVLRNLIANAIRYTDTGGVLLSARSRGDRVLLEIRDTGIGIAQESQEEVFVEFKQLHNAHRDRAQGLGLGLAIVRRLCRLLDHPLMLESRPGKGSVFSLSIQQGDASLLAAAEATPPVHSWDLTGRCLLVIDDEYEILDAMRTLLEKWGCEVITAESLNDALGRLHEEGMVPELILSDLRLRDEKTGIQAIDHIRQQYGESIHGILITGDTSPETLKMAKASSYEVLQKPVQPARLRMVIQHHLK